jgi:hypothetical protein
VAFPPTQKRDATCWGWLLPDKIVQMTICKLSHRFGGSLLYNDQGTLRQGHDATDSLLRGSAQRELDKLVQSNRTLARFLSTLPMKP